MSQPPRRQVTTRRASGSRPEGRGTGQPRGTTVRRTGAYAPPPRRDPFPYIMGGIIGALVVGLMTVVFLLGQSMGGGGTSGGGATGGSGTTGGANTSVPAANPTSPASQQTPGDEPPRIELKEFKALYDDPAKRPLIIDVRTKEIYDQGHIKGAISFPEAEVDARVSELPKDKLIVAYCQ